MSLAKGLCAEGWFDSLTTNVAGNVDIGMYVPGFASFQRAKRWWRVPSFHPLDRVESGLLTP